MHTDRGAACHFPIPSQQSCTISHEFQKSKSISKTKEAQHDVCSVIPMGQKYWRQTSDSSSAPKNEPCSCLCLYLPRVYFSIYHAEIFCSSRILLRSSQPRETETILRFFVNNIRSLTSKNLKCRSQNLNVELRARHRYILDWACRDVHVCLPPHLVFYRDPILKPHPHSCDSLVYISELGQDCWA